MSPPILITARACTLSQLALNFVQAFQIDAVEKEVELGDTAALLRLAPESRYLRTPVLVHGQKTIEDVRAIVRYLDEVFLSAKLFTLPVAEQSLFFDILGAAYEGREPKIPSTDGLSAEISHYIRALFGPPKDR